MWNFITVLYPPSPTFPACGPNQATCHNRECINKTQVCDGHYDCGDGSDESRCPSSGYYILFLKQFMITKCLLPL